MVRDYRVEKNEITKLACLYDPNEADLLDQERKSKVQIIGVGWERKIHIWPDDKLEEVETTKTLPQSK